MRKLNLTNFMASTREFINKRSPEILTGIGIAGMITTTVLAVRATPKALELIEEKKDEDAVDRKTCMEAIHTRHSDGRCISSLPHWSELCQCKT